MNNSLFEKTLSLDKFLITTEIGPARGGDISEMAHHIDLVKDKVDAINITDHQSSVMSYQPIGGCIKVKEYGGEPILQWKPSLCFVPLKWGRRKFLSPGEGNSVLGKILISGFSGGWKRA